MLILTWQWVLIFEFTYKLENETQLNIRALIELYIYNVPEAILNNEKNAVDRSWLP